MAHYFRSPGAKVTYSPIRTRQYVSKKARLIRGFDVSPVRRVNRGAGRDLYFASARGPATDNGQWKVEVRKKPEDTGGGGGGGGGSTAGENKTYVLTYGTDSGINYHAFRGPLHEFRVTTGENGENWFEFFCYGTLTLFSDACLNVLTAAPPVPRWFRASNFTAREIISVKRCPDGALIDPNGIPGVAPPPPTLPEGFLEGAGDYIYKCNCPDFSFEEPRYFAPTAPSHYRDRSWGQCRFLSPCKHIISSARDIRDNKALSVWLAQSRGDSAGSEFANINENDNFQKWLWGRAFAAAMARQRRTSRNFQRIARSRYWDNWRRTLPLMIETRKQMREAARAIERAEGREAWIENKQSERAAYKERLGQIQWARLEPQLDQALENHVNRPDMRFRFAIEQTLRIPGEATRLREGLDATRADRASRAGSTTITDTIERNYEAEYGY